MNRKAIVTLDRIWPNDKTTKQPITNPDRIAATNFVTKLQRACAKLNTQFIDYRPDTGSWVFNVEHFSKYALVDSDDDGEENTLEQNVDSKTHPKPVLQKPKIVKPTENASPKTNVSIKSNLIIIIIICINFLFLNISTGHKAITRSFCWS